MKEGFSKVVLYYRIPIKDALYDSDVASIKRLFARSLEVDKGYALGVKYLEASGVKYIQLQVEMTPQVLSELKDLAEDVSLEALSVIGRIRSLLATAKMLPDKQEDEDEAAD